MAVGVVTSRGHVTLSVGVATFMGHVTLLCMSDTPSSLSGGTELLQSRGLVAQQNSLRADGSRL